MNHANLTARYRPQTFAELAGQETVRAILSRAAAEDKVAPAYLFSGTRGVGKTTVARIFAKALNCVAAPTAEPCNECARCRQITQGVAVDVVEIDGASNRGIDDVRKLKEIVGYAPMEGRYKVFIIDEAHMLSRDAFNALLKTLEEPPATVTFILATTEPHKFPATIISRCQHYVFKRLPEHGLEAHLAMVLEKEGVPAEASALRLIARRAAGSVRDAMSLLGQVLALGSEALTEKDTRAVLGLAGQELFFTLFRTLREGNGAAVTRLVGEMLDSGLDLGFFLREMALCWRNMFILRQAEGDGGANTALAVLDIPEKEAALWREEAASFELAHIHAAWQMTVDGQRRVLTSLEPALALELLLLNIAMLPRLLSLEGLARMGRAAAGRGEGGSGAKPGPANSGSPAPDPSGNPAPGGACSPVSPERLAPETARPRISASESASVPMDDAPLDDAPVDDAAAYAEFAASMASPECAEDMDAAHATDSMDPMDPMEFVETGRALPEDCSWSAFLRFCEQQQFSGAFSSLSNGLLHNFRGEWRDGFLELTPKSEFCAQQVRVPETNALFAAMVRGYYGDAAEVRILEPPAVKTAAEVREELRGNPAVRLLEQEMGARLVDYGVWREPSSLREQ